MTKQERNREYHLRYHEEAKPAYEAFISCYPFTLDDLDGEQWRNIEGFDGYQISNFGRVKSFKFKKPCIRKPSLSRGYLRVNLGIGGEKKKSCSIHILVAKAFIPNPEKKPEVNHDDGRKFNCHVSNLFWATSSENTKHAYSTGLRVALRGEDCPYSKIKSNADILYIRENPDDLTQEQLAERFGIKISQVSRIQHGKRWQHVGGTIGKKRKRKRPPRIPEEIRAQIRADRATGQYSKAALARKFGYARKTIRIILHESAE